MAEKTAKPKKISTIKWIILIGGTLIVDVLQFLADLTGAGVAVSEAAKPFIGVGIVLVCQFMKINIINKPKRLGSVLAGFGLDAVTGGLAPFWVIDAIYICYDTKKEERIAQKQFEQKMAEEAGQQAFLYAEGRRASESEIEIQTRNTNLRPRVVDGVNAPRS